MKILKKETYAALGHGMLGQSEPNYKKRPSKVIKRVDSK